MSHDSEDNRVKQIAIGVGILLTLTVVICGTLLGWGYLPGLLGEWIGMMIGVVTTPFLLEASFIIFGLLLVIGINHWRREREGDEFVYLDQVQGGDAPGKLPEHASWAIYRNEPLKGENPSLLAQAEGALAIQDYESAAECIGSMSEEELKQPETLVVRIELARATGRDALAAQLESELRSVGSIRD